MAAAQARDPPTNPANFVPLSPLSLLRRTADVYPDKPAVVYGDLRRSWADLHRRSWRMASALRRLGLRDGDTVSILCANLPEMLEAHFAVPMAGCVLNTINTRLDVDTVRFILGHARARVLMVDREFGRLAARAVEGMGRAPILVGIDDPTFEGGEMVGDWDYDRLLATGGEGADWRLPDDEWQAISLNYTSGTTANPKGVLYSHRGAYLNALSNVVSWGLPAHPVYLWTLPMYHCNGWCFPWSLAAVAGTSVCLRHVRNDAVFEAMDRHRVTHFCCAPVVLNGLLAAPADQKRRARGGMRVMTGGAPPPAAVIEGMREMGIDVTHAYGLTETYGPVTLCAWREDLWGGLGPEEQASKKARQGVRAHMLEGLMVADPESLAPVAMDGKSMGEVVMRGNNVMKGYLNNPGATRKALEGGWFRSGDLAVWHPDGYIQIKDRSKDIIISGGENISSIEVEDVLFRHPGVLEAAVVAKRDDKWGETPCAFVTPRPGARLTEEDVIRHCRERLPRFKVPRYVVFAELPKTSTGKVKKFDLRRMAESMPLRSKL